jgi:hypothetical protein
VYYDGYNEGINFSILKRRQTMSDQELIVRASMSIAKGIEYYALSGEEDFMDVASILNEAMRIINQHLTKENMVKMILWLEKQKQQLKEA